jgi:hypothetical protein
MLASVQTSVSPALYRAAHKAQMVGFHGMEFALIPLDKVTVLNSSV